LQKKLSPMSVRSFDPAILFDLDGTLIDTAYEHVLAWSAALKSAGISIPNWKIHRRIGMSGQALMRQVFREHSPQRRKVNLQKLEDKHGAIFQKMVRHIQPLPGADKLLRHLTRLGVPWAIATTGSSAQTKELLRVLRIPPNTVVVTGDDVAKAKPSPEIFATAAERLNVPIENCVVVGDSVWDMLAAGRRRALGVGILSGGYSQQELEQSGAFRVYSDPADMLQHIEDIGLE
jgi:HAD superfamily hydrolase (TIGR01549 family)